MEYNEGLGSIRTKKAPKKTGIGYKVFYQKDGKLYPPMVANPGGVDTPIGVWLDADAAPIVGNSKTGRPQVKNGGKGTQGGSGTLAYRPGWHLGLIPYAIQFNRKDENGEKTLFPKDFVWAEVEYAADKNYQKEAEAEGYTENGKYRHSYAGLKHLPTDGYYIYRTNPNPETDPWIITGAMKVNRILTDKEVDDLVRKAGREPQRREQESISSVLSGLGMSVHHNSPYLLKRADGSFIDPETGERLGFDHRFMSKGEGAQVHGWGSYFSVKDLKDYGNNGKIKVFYKEVELNLDIDDFRKKFPNYIEYANVYTIFRRMELGKSASDAIEFLKNYYNEEIKYHPKGALEHLKFIDTLNPSDFKMGRHHYHVEIPDNDGTNYIEEDKKLSKKVLNKVVKEFERMGWKFSNTKGGIYLDSPKGDDTLAINPLDKGGDLYWKISSLNNFTPEKASKLLHDAGFVGIHYFGRQDGECYVIFNENDAKIVGHDLFGVEGIRRYYGGKGIGDTPNEVLNFIDKEIRIAQSFAQQPKGSIPSYQRQNMNQRVTGRLETLWKNRDYDTFNKALDKIKEAGVIFSKNNSIWERHKNTPTEDLYPSPEFKNAMNVIAKLKPNMDVDNETLKWAIEYPIRKLASENRVRSLRVVVQALKDKQDKEGITIFEPDEWFWKYLQSDTEEAINKENPESGVIYEADGCTVEDNVELSRVQIFFPGKPSYEIISYLKQHGFRWSPSNKAWQRQNTPEGRRQALDFAKKFFPEELKKEVDEVVEEVEEKPIENKTKNSYEFEYQLLGRLKDDCDYYLGNGNRFAKQLWAGNEIDQIKKMVELWDMLPEKPEWLTRNELERYSMALTGKSIDELYKSNDGSSSLLDFANGLSTLLTQGKVTWAEAQKIATEMNLKASNQELIQACELAVVMAARKIAQTDYTIRAKYEQIRDLYDNQPTIQPKDGESRFLQQFSTPAPLAFMAGEFVKVNDNYNSAYLEPTAGNGMLAIALPADRTCVNELDVIRYNNLTTQGFLHVSNQDATKYSVPNKMPTGGLFHGVITNPPFADLKRNEYLIRRGKKGDKEIEYTFSKLDYKLAIMALDQMANNGRAAIIVGGKLGSKVYDFKNAYWNKNDMLFGEYASFVAYLNRQYNLVDILYISGDLYAKQGTTFPIIMLLIDGRKQWDSSIDCVWHKYDPDKDAEIESFTEYFNRIYPHIEGNTETVNNDDKARKLRLAKAKAKALLLYAYAQKNK